MSKPIEILTDAEITKVLTVFYSADFYRYNDLQLQRNRLIFLLMCDAGLRTGEVIQLRTSDLWIRNYLQHSVAVRAEISKSNKTRLVPLSFRLKTYLKQYQETYLFDTSFHPDRFLICNSQTPSSLTTRQVHRIITTITLRALGRSVRPHVLRHTFASRLLKVSNTRIVQELLGHRCLTSTQVYTHPNTEDFHASIDKMQSIV